MCVCVGRVPEVARTVLLSIELPQRNFHQCRFVESGLVWPQSISITADIWPWHNRLLQDTDHMILELLFPSKISAYLETSGVTQLSAHWFLSLFTLSPLVTPCWVHVTGLDCDCGRCHDDAIVTYGFLGTFLIAVFVLFPSFSTNIDVIRIVFLLFWLSNFFVFWPQPGPTRVGYERIYCIVSSLLFVMTAL